MMGGVEIDLLSLRRFVMGHEGEVWCTECADMPEIGAGGYLSEMVEQALAHNAEAHALATSPI